MIESDCQRINFSIFYDEKKTMEKRKAVEHAIIIIILIKKLDNYNDDADDVWMITIVD